MLRFRTYLAAATLAILFSLSASAEESAPTEPAETAGSAAPENAQIAGNKETEVTNPDGGVTAAPAVISSDETVETGKKEENESPKLDKASHKMSCPFANETRNECGKETMEVDDLFGEKASFDPFKKDYSQENRCKVWWWTQHARSHQYQPLVEWATFVEEALLESIDTANVREAMGFAPTPPLFQLNGQILPTASCTRGRPSDAARLTKRLRHLNLRNLNAETLNDLLNHCLAFELETAVWKRITTKVVGSYVIPIGSVNFVVLGVPRIATTEDLALARDVSASSNIQYVTVGQCPVSQEPRLCAEGFFNRNTFQYGFNRTTDLEMYALPYRMELDTLFQGTEIREPVPVKVQVTPEGRLDFFYNRISDNKSRPVSIEVDEAGSLSLRTLESLCDPETPEGIPLVLKPMAFGDRVKKLKKKISIYTADDFPQSARLSQTPGERGCKTGQKYSQWAAESANAAKHFSHHGWPIDTVYRTIAALRYKVNLDGKGVRRGRDDLIYGLWRKQSEESPIVIRGPFEKQAISFALGKNAGAGERGIALKTITIDGRRASEVWYYQKSVQLTAPSLAEERAHVLVVSLDGFNDIYANSVIAKLVEMSNTCGKLDDHKSLFIESMYALFNADPLQRGGEIVNKVFMAAMYQYLFGTKLATMSKMEIIDLDAVTMNQKDFKAKYLPLL